MNALQTSSARLAPHRRTLYCCILVAGFALAGCASQAERPAKTAEKARNTSADIQLTEQQMDRTVAALQNVLSQPADLKAALDNYSRELDKTKAMARTMDSDAAQMRAQSEAWLAGWQKQHDQISSEELRAVSEQRRQQVMQRFAGIQDSYSMARSKLGAFIQRLDDVQRTLSNDLTPQGTTAVANTDVVQNVSKLASDTRRNLDNVHSQTMALAEDLRPTPTQTTSSNGSANQSGTGSATSSNQSANKATQ